MPSAALDPAHRRAWMRLVDEHADALFFHRADWLDVLERAYPGFEPRHRLVEAARPQEAVGIAPAYGISNLLSGRRLSSQPFNFYGGPLYESVEVLDHLLRQLAGAALGAGARVLDVRTAEALPPALVDEHGLVEGGQYLRHVVELADTDPRARYARRFRERLQALEARDRHRGVEIRSLDPLREVDALHRVLVEAYGRRHGTLAQPRRFLRALFEILGPGGVVQGLGFFEGGRLEGTVVLGRHRRTTAYLFGAARPRAEERSPIARLLDRALRDAADRGDTAVDLGITSRRHRGLAQFKTRFGAEPRPLYFYRRALQGRLGPAPDYYGSLEILRPLVTRTPVPVLASASSLAAGWLG